jgi:hypothetical protein
MSLLINIVYLLKTKFISFKFLDKIGLDQKTCSFKCFNLSFNTYPLHFTNIFLKDPLTQNNFDLTYWI